MDIERLIDTLEQIRAMPEALVDKEENLEIYKTILALSKNDQQLLELKSYIAANLKGIQKVIEWVKPYKLPDDYLLFLCLYAGISIQTKNHDFTLDGMGPHAEQWYPYLMGDIIWTKPAKDGLLTLGDLENPSAPLYNERYCTFLLNLGNPITQPYKVLAIGPMDGSYDVLYETLKNPTAYQHKWAVVGSSFTEWLEKIAAAKTNFSEWLPFPWPNYQ